MPGYVGFANLPNQIHRKSVKRGFEFTLMVVGELFLIWILYIGEYKGILIQIQCKNTGSSCHYIHYAQSNGAKIVCLHKIR